MTSSDDDEDIKRAIAMSLGETRGASPIVIGDSDEEDEDVRHAIALSLEDSKRAGNQSSTSGYASRSLKQEQPPAQQVPEPPSGESTTKNPLSGLLGLDRKAMEKERLARLGKRKRSASPASASKATPLAEALPSKTTAKKVALPKPATDLGNSSSISVQKGIQYPNGAIKRTWAYKHARTDDITLEEVLQAPANVAVISAFQFDDRWVFSKLRPEDTKQIWIMSAKGQDVQDKLIAEAVDSKIPNFKPHFPPMDGSIQNMHSKLMLLFHETHLRIVVPTANMIKFDWGETNKDVNGGSWQAAVMENSVFLIDLPRRSDGQSGRKEELTWFGSELVTFLEAQRVGKNVTEGVLKFDFTGTGHIAFVHSIPGAQTSQYSDHTGLPGLATALRKLKLDKVKTLELDYAASSLGALKTSFLDQLYKAASGQSSVSEDFLERIRIYFPTHDTVMNSTGGPDCGGIITLSPSFYNSDTFPKQCMRDYKSTRPGVLSHNKLLLARARRADGTPVAWAYVGSANLSESAWGSQKELKSGKMGKLSIKNWECGVVVPVPEESMKTLKLAEGEVPPMSVFKDVVEIPFQYPGERYGSKQPWFFRDHRG